MVRSIEHTSISNRKGKCAKKVLQTMATSAQQKKKKTSLRQQEIFQKSFSHISNGEVTQASTQAGKTRIKAKRGHNCNSDSSSRMMSSAKRQDKKSQQAAQRE